MPIEFRCSKCGRLLRTDDDTAGRMAQCPECGGQTQVPRAEKGNYPPSPPILPPSDSGVGYAPQKPESIDATGDWSPYQRPAGPSPVYSGDSVAALKRISAPATCLIITALLGLLIHFIAVMTNIFDVGLNAAAGPQQFPPFMIKPISVAFGGLAIIMSIVVLLGGIKMKRLENYWLAVTASILALIPCTSPCCFLGLPFGIWSLVVLSDPLVKMSFKS
jgi:hypothetical protein